MKIYTSLIVAAIAAIMIYVFLIGPRGIYNMQTVFLIVPQDHATATQNFKVMNDIFYIIDSSLPKKTHITHRENTGVFILTVSGDRISDVQKIHHSVVQTISRNVKKYYHMPDDIVIHVVSSDAQPQKNSLLVFAPYFLMTVIAVGAIAGVFAIFSLFDALREARSDVNTRPMDGKKIFEKFHTNQTSSPDALNIQREQIQKTTHDDRRSLSLDERTDENEKNANKEEQKAATTTSRVRSKESVPFAVDGSETLSVDTPEGFAAIPGNLPVIDVAQLGFTSKNKNDEKNDTVEHNVKEPTEEELKARLNQLLNGKL